MKKLGSKDCKWCNGYGFALATVDRSIREVQKCDACNVYDSDFKVKQMLRDYPDVCYELEISITMLDVSIN